MQGPLAQMVALTCHGNAVIGGHPLSPFLHGNSTCQFCHSVSFIAGGGSEGGEPKTITLAESPDRWLEYLSNRAILGLRLVQSPRNDPGISDRNSSAFVGGGRQWKIEGLRKAGMSESWLSRWELHDRNAPDRRIWKVTYGLVELAPTAPPAMREVAAIAADLRAALNEIRHFSQQHDLSSFAQCFAEGLRALDDPHADIGYHKDLYLPGTVSEPAEAVLKAAMSAWVFGGMGSWNDMSFEGAAQEDYDRLSENLFSLLNEGIAPAASDSFPAAR